MQSNEYDVIVIGGSFAGLSAALQIARCRRRVLIIDGGKTRNRFSISVQGFIGYEGQSSNNILRKFQEELSSYKTVSFLVGSATKIEGYQDNFVVITDVEQKFLARRLVLSFGVIDHLPKIKGLEKHWGKSVLHCPYCNAYEVSDQRLGVIATNAESLHQAIILLEWSQDITLFTNNAIDLNDLERQHLLELGIKIEPIKINELLETSDSLQGVKLYDGRIIEVDTIFTLSRTSLGSTLAEDLNCEIEAGFFGPVIKVDPVTKETTTPGVFAAGDITRSFHKVSLAVADGNLAGVFSHKSLVLP